MSAQKVKGVVITYDPKAEWPYKINDVNDKLGRDTVYRKGETAALNVAKRMLRE